ncbi:uncharacterized protein LOC136043033 [Artemia franciscana]
MTYIRVESGSRGTIELPLEDDGSLCLTTLKSHFPDAIGLKYFCKSANVTRGIGLSEGRLWAPNEGWSKEITYVCTYTKGNINTTPLSSGSSLRYLETIPAGRTQSKTEAGSSDVLCACEKQATLLTVIKDGPNKGRQFHKCSDCGFFLWSDEVKNVQDSSHTGKPPQAQNPTIGVTNCHCAIQAQISIVKKDGYNTGRKFFVCSKSETEKCKFFQWADEILSANQSLPGNIDARPLPSGSSLTTIATGKTRSTAEAGSIDVLCACEKQATLLSVIKDGPNKGRQFYRCSECSFFLWSDEVKNVEDSNHSGRPPQAQNHTTGVTNCHCAIQAKMSVVKKSGPNTGRHFYVCSKSETGRCNFFQWADEALAFTDQSFSGMVIRVFEPEFSGKYCYLDGINAKQSYHLQVMLRKLMRSQIQIMKAGADSPGAWHVKGMTALQLMSFFQQQYTAKTVGYQIRLS